MSRSDLWLLFWFFLGMNAAYLFAFAFLTYCLVVGKRGHEELATATAVVTAAVVSWLTGYMVTGPWWAILTMPAQLAAALACARVYAYMREHRARARVSKREAGR